MGHDARGITMVDYGYGDTAPQGYELGGIPLHPMKHEHFKLDDSPVSFMMNKVINVLLSSNFAVEFFAAQEEGAFSNPLPFGQTLVS